jgi:two-component sensor histidine kinase
MLRFFVITWVLCVAMFIEGFSQSSLQSAISTYSYHPLSADKQSWQRLNLWLSCGYFRVTTPGANSDSSLIYVAHRLGLTRLLIAAEGIDDPELLTQSKWFDERKPGAGILALSRSSGKKHLELLILIGAYYTFQPNKKCCGTKDSAEDYLKKAIDESKLLNEKKLGKLASILLGKLYAQLGDRVNGDPVFNQLINECQKENDRATEARVLAYRGMYTRLGAASAKLSVEDIMEEKIGYLEKAGQLYHQLNNLEDEINVMAVGAMYYAAISRFDDAYNSLLKTYQLENSIGYPYTHYTSDNIAMTTIAQGKFGEPLKYSMESVKVSEKIHDSVGLADFYTRLSVLYYTEGGREDESLKWMLKALNCYIIAKNSNVYPNLINIVEVMGVKGKQREALDLLLNTEKKVPPVDSNDVIFRDIAFAYGYLGIKQYDFAERYALQADSIQKLAQFVSVNSKFQRTMILPLFGQIYFEKGQYTKARKYFDQYFTDSSRIPVLAADMEIYPSLLALDSIFHDAPSAVKHYKLYTQLLDSNFRVSKVRQAEELQVIYQTEEQKKQITLLNQQAKLEEANLKQATLVKNVTIGGIVAVLIIAGLLYRQNRQKQKSSNVITQKNELLQHLLTEKEWLLKEIHHRVKNNLQIVMSLLNSQSAYIDNDAALTAIHDSQHRVHAMSLIHQKLYGSENVSSIDMASYIRELASYLHDSFNTGQRIRFEYNIIPLELDVSQAVPLGLILNEAITNSIKYAFPDNTDGIINISLSNSDSNHYLLSISDNGIGMPAHFTGKKPGSLGMSLMEGLSEDLDGKFTIENSNGTVIKISFVYDNSVKRADTYTSSFVTNN